MKTRDSALQKVWSVLDQYWEDLGSPLSLRLLELRKSGNYKMIAEIIGSINNEKLALKPLRLRRTRWAIDIVKKANYLPLDIDTTRAALESWCASEKLCRHTNWLFRLVDQSAYPTYYGPNNCHLKQIGIIYKWLPKIRTYVKKLLGPIPDVYDLFGGFGPGATLSNTRRASSMLQKLLATPTLTESAVWFYPALPKRLRDVWGPLETWSIVEAGRFSCVPKNYKTERPIMVEPLVNASIQRGLGEHMSKRLTIFQLDKKTAPVKHAQLACEGSVMGNWATVDLSSASDTIASELVRAVVPSDWFRLLSAARTRKIQIPKDYFKKYPELFESYGIRGPIHTLEKFSSMGNGFTFELETIIFASICAAVCGSINAVGGVFGDDMIVGTRYYEELVSVLNAFGFIINDEKSYHTGFFRESCGGDYAKGIFVKGVTLKEEPNCVTEWYDLHNRIWLQNEIVGLFGRTLNTIRGMVPSRFRLNIPHYLGSGGFYSHKCKPLYKNSIYYYKCYIPTANYISSWENFVPPEVQLAAGLYGGIPTNAKGYPLGIPKHQSIPSCKLAWVPVS